MILTQVVVGRKICHCLFWNLREKISFSNDERARPPTQLKLEFATDIFIDQIHKFQNSYFNPIQNGGMGGVGVAKKSPPIPTPGYFYKRKS